jgi:hypothetical protein
MTTASNSYAEKVFAEHPIALWSLDDPIDYVSLITEDDRNMRNGWVFKNASNTTLTPSTVATSYATTSTWLPAFPEPAFESYANQLFVPPSGDQLKCLSPVIAQQADLEISKTISISTYIDTFNRAIDLRLGIEYTDSSSQVIRETKNIDLLSISNWQFVSQSFELPNAFTDLKIVVEITFNSAPSGYYVLLNGISFGQRSEQFNVESLGVNPSTIPTAIAVSGYGVGTKSYGLQEINGYYMANTNKMFANNSSLPMVFGSESCTKITPNPEGPSLILPGYGFMNVNGQYSDLTFETWLKIQSSATEPRRILGPIASTDGLYVNDSFLALKVGKYNGSYYVGEWDRPMLVAIRLSGTVASLTVNGEEVITINIDPDQVNFPAKLSGTGKDQDWIGFYAYNDVPIIEIDCVGIYPYEVPAIVEKRRWVYGQGVETSENINGSSLGKIMSVDYTFSKYAKNYIYPDLGKWNQGITENIVADNLTLSLPQYELPSIVFNNKTLDQWYTDNSSLSSIFGTYLSLKPNSGWNSTDGYILFSSLNLLQQDVKAFYGLFESNASVSTKQTLFMLENTTTGESLEITLQGATTAYTYRYLSQVNGIVTTQEELIYSDTLHVPGDFLFAGLDINKFAQNFGGRVANFLGSKQSIKLYVGGKKEFTNTFAGNIYRIGFSTARNLEKISNVFSSTGLPAGFNAFDANFVSDAGSSIFTNDNPSQSLYNWNVYLDGGDEYFGNDSGIYEQEIDGGSVYSLLVSNILNHVGSYTLVPKIYLENFMLDIAVNSYWQDYVPLTYFSKYINSGTQNSDGSVNTYQDLDFIQFNIDYPAIQKFLTNSFDTTSSLVRTFVSFQELKNDAAISVSRFNKIVFAPKNGVVVPGDDWQTINDDGTIDYVKYEVVDDTIIYPPSNMSFKQVSIVLHVELLSNGIMENPVKIRSLQLASQVLDGAQANPVGTKFGLDVFPYRKSSEFYDYKTRNPYSIYKGSTPYMYLTSTSGLRLRGFYDGDLDRGIEIPINTSSTSFFKIAAWQILLRYDDEAFPQSVTEIMEIFAKSKTLETSGEDYIRHIKFYLVPDDELQDRGRIYAIDADTGLQQSDITFYINGKKVLNPVLDRKTWTALSFSFDTPVDFSGYPGAFRVTGPIIFNNVSYYQSSEADEASRSVYRQWADVKITDNLDKDWAYWKNLDADPAVAGTQAYTWRNLLVVSSQGFAGFDTKSVYKKYTGTDRIVIDSDTQFRFKNYEYVVYKDISWQSNIITPV